VSTERELRDLYQEHAPFVRRVIVRLGAPVADVDDLLQEVFLIALKKIDEFEGRSSHRTWLYGISLRVVAASRRRAKVRAMLGFGTDVEAQAVDEHSPLAAIERRDAQIQVQKALSKISEKKRAVFILFEVEGLSGEEIAEAVGCPLKTVWTRLYHARQAFLRELRRQGVMDDAGILARASPPLTGDGKLSLDPPAADAHDSPRVQP
jgi:RNA polymerase sigma-70 factor (ECF subfamily)